MAVNEIVGGFVTTMFTICLFPEALLWIVESVFSYPIMYPFWLVTYAIFQTGYVLLNIPLWSLSIELTAWYIPFVNATWIAHSTEKMVAQFDCSFPGTETYLQCPYALPAPIVRRSAMNLFWGCAILALLYTELKSDPPQSPEGKKAN